MKVVFFLLMVLSLLLPVNVYADTNTHPILDKMEDKIRKLMDVKSKLPENEVNSFDYWCLSDKLNTIVNAKTDVKYSGKIIDKDKLAKIGDAVLEEYSSDENFMFYSNYTESVFLDYGYPPYNNHIQFVINGESPLKMSKAQEISSKHDYITFIRSFMLLYEIESCTDALEDMLNINIATIPDEGNYRLFMNIRGDIVSVKVSSVEKLFEYGYLVLPLI